MPAKLERCVAHVKKTIKPRRAGQSKESAAYAACNASLAKSKLKKYRSKKRT